MLLEALIIKLYGIIEAVKKFSFLTSVLWKYLLG